jgi:hypothetical protein
MSPSIPSNFNDTTALHNYVKDLGVATGVGFVVPALVLSAIIVFVFVKYCGGSGKTRVKFPEHQRSTLLVSSAIICIICIATCAVGWKYNDQIQTDVQQGTVTLQGVIDSSASLMNAVNNSVASLKSQLISDIYAKSNPIVNNISALMVPLSSILGVITEVENTLNNLTDLTNVIVDNITIVKADLTSLGTIEQGGIITGVPSASEIPDVDSSFTTSLNSSVNSLKSIIHYVHNMTNDVNDTLGAVNTTITSKLFQLTDGYDKNANQVLSYVSEFDSKIASTNISYGHVSSEILHYSSIRTSIMTAVLVLPLFLSALSLVGVVFHMKVVIKISAGLSFIFMFWYFMAAGLNFVASYTVDQVCLNRDSIVASVLSIADESITVPGTNTTVEVSTKVQQLLYCAENETLIEIFEFDFLIDDLTGQITDQIQTLTNETNQLNQTSLYTDSVNSLVAMENTSVNLDFLQNSDLPTVHQELKNISNQINATINSPAYFSSLQAVNDITNDLTLTNGTEIHEYYGDTNITTLNCTADPYSKLTVSQQEDLCNKSSIAIALTLIRDKTVSQANAVYGNVTDINNRLYGFQNSLPQIYEFQNETHADAAQIRTYLDAAYYGAAGVIAYVQLSAGEVIGVIDSGTNAIVTDTECAYLGIAYQDLSNTVCQDVKPALEIITAMMIIGGCMLFASTVVGMVFAHRLEREFVHQK